MGTKGVRWGLDDVTLNANNFIFKIMQKVEENFRKTITQFLHDTFPMHGVKMR